MSLKLNTQQENPLQTAAKKLSAMAQGGQLAGQFETQGALGLESLSEAQDNALNETFDSVSQNIRETLASVGIESIDEVGLKAAAVVAMASGDPAAYARHTMTMQASGDKLVNLGDSVSVHPSLEAFDEKPLKEAIGHSIIFNYGAARQDEGSEMLYPTTVATPDIAAMEATVNRLLVFQEVRHATSGKAAKFNKRNLIEAAVDHTILNDNSTRLVPALSAESAASFAPAAVAGQRSIMVAGVPVPTAPLCPGKELDILGLSAYAPLIGAHVLDHTDAVDSRVALSALLIQHDEAELGINFSTVGMSRSTFQKSQEGNYKELNLHFPIQEITFSAQTVDLANAAVPALAGLAANGWTVIASTDASGRLNVETGTTKVWFSPLTVTSIRNNTGAEVDMTLAAAADIKAAVEAFEIVGFDLDTNRTNSNLRTRGLQMDITYEVERYAIPLGAPIAVPTPHTQSKEIVDLKGLTAAARTIGRNTAISKIFSYAEQLERWCSSPRDPEAIPEVEGLGRFVVKPYFKRLELNLVEALNSMRSQDKPTDVSAALTSAMRSQAYAAYQESRIQPAMDAQTNNSGEKPKLLVLTDQKLAAYIMVPGDDRTFGIVFDKYQLECSVDKRMYGKIVMTFGREKPEAIDPLHFGAHLWIPELAVSVPVNFNGANIKHSMVQPRQLYINNLPILIIIDVVGLDEVLADKTLTPALAEITGPSAWMAGLSA